MKILIGYDGSPSSQDALSDLTRAGLPAEAKVRILTALNPWMPPDFLSTRESGVKAYYSAAYAQALAEAESADGKAKAIANRALDFLSPLFPNWELSVEPGLGPPDQAILHMADEWQPDLICLGTHDHSDQAGRTGGSVSQKVLQHAHGSVRIGRAAVGTPMDPTRIILAMDGSSHAEAAVQEILRRQWPKGTEVCLMTIMDFRLRVGDAVSLGFSELPPDLPVKDDSSEPRSRWPWMEQVLDKAQRKLEKRDLKVTKRIFEDDPREALIREAATFQAHGLFMGSRGLSGMKRLLLGSVSLAVALHAPCTVEIVRTPAWGKGKPSHAED